MYLGMMGGCETPNPTFNGRRGTGRLLWRASLARAVNSTLGPGDYRQLSSGGISIAMKLSTLDFDYACSDFLIDGTPLLLSLKKHEGVLPEAHISSVLAQPGACDRLLGLADPDLHNGHVAIYLCGHCGGYDGNPIGVKLSFDGDCAIWQEFGYHYDYAEQEPHPFEKVKSYAFDLTQYRSLLQKIKIYEPSASQ